MARPCLSAALVALASLLPEQDRTLQPGGLVAGEITRNTPQVHTGKLDKEFDDAPVRGHTYRFEPSRDATWTIELRSHLFDAYLVLRDAHGTVLAEDDDGLRGTHARIAIQLRAGVPYRVTACALHGELGTFELRTVEGKPARLGPKQEAMADLADAQRCLAVRDRQLGQDDPRVAKVLVRLAKLYESQHQYGNAEKSYRRAADIHVSREADAEASSVLISLGALLSGQRRYRDAVPVQRQALEIRMKAHERDPLAIAQAEHNLAYALARGRVDLAEAERNYRSSIQRFQDGFGRDAPVVGRAKDNLATLLQTLTQFEEAEKLFRESLRVLINNNSNRHPAVATGFNNLAVVLDRMGKTDEAIRLQRRALKIVEGHYGPESLELVDNLGNLTSMLRERGKLEEATTCIRRALAILAKARISNTVEVASCLNVLGTVHASGGRLEDAAKAYRSALAIREKRLGPDHELTAVALANLGNVLLHLGETDEAENVIRRALSIRTRGFGRNNANTARCQRDLAKVLGARGLFVEAEAMAREALETQEKVLGPEHSDVGESLVTLSSQLTDMGRLVEAQPLLRRAHAILVAARGEDDPDATTCLNNLASLLAAMDDRPAAEILLRRALAAKQRSSPRHPETHRTLVNLGICVFEQGRLAEAENLLQRAVDTGAGHAYSDVGQMYVALGSLFRVQGKHREAETALRAGLAHTERMSGEAHPETTVAMTLLANLLSDLGRFDESEKLYERALDGRTRTLGDSNPFNATILDNLGQVKLRKKELDAAEPYLRKALALTERIRGADHPTVGVRLNNLACYMMLRQDWGGAAKLLKRAVDIYRASVGLNNRDGYQTMFNLGNATAYSGDAKGAWAIFRAAVGGLQARMSDLLRGSTEAQRFRYLETRAAFLSFLISLTLDPDMGLRSEERIDRLYEAILAWQGQVSRSMASVRGKVFEGRDEKRERALVELRAVQAQLLRLLSRTTVDRSGNSKQGIQALARRREILELRVLRGAEHVSTAERPVTIAEVARSLPDGAALVHFHGYRQFHWNAPEQGFAFPDVMKEPLRLSAWILRSGSKHVTHVDLGAASVVEEALVAFLRNLRRESGQRRSNAGRKLYDLVWQPVEGAVGDAQLVLVSADRFLGKLPLGILQDTDSSHLIEKHRFAYVSNVMSAIRRTRPPKQASERALLCVGGVDYIGGGVAADARSKSSSERGRSWAFLKGSAGEARLVTATLDDAFPKTPSLLLTGNAATEERLKRELPRHTHVHLVTHGFFEADPLRKSGTGVRKLSGGGLQSSGNDALIQIQDLVRAHPSLLSGIVCAGANATRPRERNDGLLTAEEVSWLDLSRCDLAVLSACETGLGHAKGGEGMLSLRRAFHQAGAKTVVSSLWKVGDETTKQLMSEFYRRLWKENSPLDALRGAQLRMIEENRSKHRGRSMPASWGAFVLSGEWR